MVLAKRPVGRPPISEEDRASVIAKVIMRVGSGIPVCAAVRGLVSPNTFWRWHSVDARLQEQLAQARMIGVASAVDEMIEIADRNDLDPADKKVRIYARERSARMLAPRKYQPKIDVRSAGERIQIDELSIAIRLASLIIKALKRAGHSRIPQGEDFPPHPAGS